LTHASNKVILTERILVNYSAETETVWHYDDYGCHEICSNCHDKVKWDMVKPIKTSDMTLNVLS
jgi:hypothetical protein